MDHGMKPIRVWLTPSGPNPWKVVVILEELRLPYEVVSFKFDDVKKKPFIDLNPNGRAPAIEDPNTDLVLWESGAIVTYLVQQYDKNKLLTYNTLKEQHLINQWLHFQMSGQGPYWGTAGWFNVLHPEKVPSAIERYNNQVKRVLGVLEGVLADKNWLVGDKMTYADLAFVPWNDRLESVLLCPDEDKFAGFPKVKAWHESMTSRPAWKRAMEKRDKLMDEQGLMWNGMPKGIKNFQEYEAKIAAGEDTTPKDS
ncbi:glutathione S-transferase [Naviculisporaceae sp. PSN 640]